MFTSAQLTEGNLYSRNDLSTIFAITDATINTGIFQPKGTQSIWLFITEEKAKDRPQLVDLLVGDTLYWDGQPQGGKDALIIEHKKRGLEILVFYRKRKDEYLPGYKFKYEGRFSYQSHSGVHPTQFVLKKIDDLLLTVEKDLEAIEVEEETPTKTGEKSFTPGLLKEGKLISRLVNTHERNPRLRADAIKFHGTICQICGFSFTETYGELGAGFIEVHHLKPVSSYEGETHVDPQEDMAVLCANCHRMLHRRPDNPLTINELKNIIKKCKTH
ncbi:HNH endonuclease [Tengunoibacter tsumagoiensis]|uniref:HNH domain-containing protein n=1 Tax=Tengunoibacter tsumagoiensis TaxID=2014871 RepID=A0A401ZZ08_9CHLR|nr:HNH endonuclease [Tengunoibacter tsumagoiensis]GCE12080.1 hypothetical protein KTT_19390 [Tengunoibacter tsumagoiensis]